jgi:hypothetical protein
MRWGRRVGLSRLLQLLLLLLLLCQMVPDDTTGCRTDDGMMTRHVPCDRAHGRAFDATLCRGVMWADQQSESDDGHSQSLHHGYSEHHAITPRSQQSP